MRRDFRDQPVVQWSTIHIRYCLCVHRLARAISEVIRSVRSIVYPEDFRGNSPIRKKNIKKGSLPASIVGMLVAIEAHNGFGLESAVQ